MRRAWAPMCLVLLGLVLAGCGPAQRCVDDDQGRLDSATPPLHTLGEVGQSLVARHAGLTAIELLLVLYGDPAQPAGPDEVWHCTLRRGSPTGPEVDAVQVPLAGRRHNDPITITFRRQPDSRGATYYLSVRAVSGERAALWFTRLEAYAPGSMFRDGEAAQGDLRFVTFYDYDAPGALADAIGSLVGAGPTLVAMAWLLAVPGLALYLALGRSKVPVALADLVVVVVSLSLAVLPLLLLWTTTAGLGLSAWAACAVLAGLTGAVAWGLCRRPLPVTVGWGDLALGAVLLLTLAVRFLQARELVVPPWVDSVHHTFIAERIMAQGRVPAGYEPAFPAAGFFHHFGFHAVAAWVGWLARLGPAAAVLAYGQVLNALAAATTYLVARRLSGKPVAGVAAAAAVGVLSPMPAYYLSWGRYTHLAGMALLPLAMVATMDALAQDGWRPRLLAAVAVAGLGLAHYRVAVFYVAFVVAYLPFVAWERRRSRQELSNLGQRLIALGGLAFLLLLPWLARLWGLKLASLLRAPESLQGAPGQNALPLGLLWFPGTRPLYWAAALGAVVGLVRRRRAPALVLLWGALLYALVNLPWGSDRGSWLVDNASLVISIYLPVAVLVGELAAGLWDLALRLPRALERPLGPALVPIVLAVALAGGWRQLPVVNPQTVLVTQDDLVAMAWIREHTPREAGFLVNAVPWQLGLYRGTDGGWWIPLLTGRRCTLPPVLYKSATEAFRRQVDEVAEAVARGELPGGAAWRERLRALGVSHVYVGAKGGPLKLEQLQATPGLRPVYVHGPVWIFQVE